MRRFQDLLAWQRCMTMCDVIFEISAAGPVTGDGEFRTQIRNAAKKAAPLIAEGFLRFTRPELVRYLRMARAEIGEVQTHLERGARQQYFTAEQLEHARAVTDEAMKVTTGLLRSKLQ